MFKPAFDSIRVIFDFDNGKKIVHIREEVRTINALRAFLRGLELSNVQPLAIGTIYFEKNCEGIFSGIVAECGSIYFERVNGQWIVRTIRPTKFEEKFFKKLKNARCKLPATY